MFTFIRISLIFTIFFYPGNYSIASYSLNADNSFVSISQILDSSSDRSKPASGLAVVNSSLNKIDILRSSADLGDSYDGVWRGFKKYKELRVDSPDLVAEGGGYLYVWSEASGRLLQINLKSGSTLYLWKAPVSFKATHMTASHFGEVILANSDNHQYVWINTSEIIQGKSSQYGDPIGKVRSNMSMQGMLDIAFLTADSFVVLDRKRTVRFFLKRESSGHRWIEEADDEYENSDLKKRNFVDIATYGGVLYVAEPDQVYTYSRDHKNIKRVNPKGEFSDIKKIEASLDSIYVLDGRELNSISKKVTVEVHLGSDKLTNETVLLKLYDYFAREKSLPLKKVEIEDDIGLSELLTSNNVLITGQAIRSSATKNRGVLGNIGVLGFLFSPSTERLSEHYSTRSFELLLCRQNRTLCDQNGGLFLQKSSLSKGDELEIPYLDITKELRLTKFDLDGNTIQKTLKNVISEDGALEDATQEKVIRKFNPQFEDVSYEKLLKVKTGEVVLPAENFRFLVNVRSSDFYNENSVFLKILNEEGITYYTKSVFTDKKSFSSLSGLSSHQSDYNLECDDIQKRSKELFSQIKHPRETFDLNDRTLNEMENSNAWIGIVEKKSSTNMEHVSFFDERGATAWYGLKQSTEYGVLSYSLEPIDIALPTDFKNKYLKVVDGFDLEQHHGSHVAALIAGRQAPCWSGLLPNARLHLIDSAGPGDLNRHLNSLDYLDVKVFNFSVDLLGNETGTAKDDIVNELTKHIEKNTSDLFIAAAGQGKGDIKKTSYINRMYGNPNWTETPFPGRLGALGNVISVGADIEHAYLGKSAVDLITAGQNILSATKQTQLAISSGSSHSAPIVTAAAAFLIGEGYSAKHVKARLIATADLSMTDAESGKAFGGVFNFGNAVRFHDEYVMDFAYKKNLVEENKYLVTSKKVNKIELTVLPSVHAKKMTRDSDSLEDLDDGLVIGGAKLLSVMRSADNKDRFKVVYIDRNSGKVSIILNAKIKGSIKFKDPQIYMREENRLVDNSDKTLKKNIKNRGVNFSKINSFFASKVSYSKELK